ncbi:hypothetical protein ACA910_017503 [Epithemia clementina (nom. ined.)]
MFHIPISGSLYWEPKSYIPESRVRPNLSQSTKISNQVLRELSQSKKDEKHENPGIVGVLTTAWLDAAQESSSTQSELPKCKHPHTGEVVDLTSPCDGVSGKSQGKKEAGSGIRRVRWLGEVQAEGGNAEEQPDEVEDKGKKGKSQYDAVDLPYCSAEELWDCEPSLSPSIPPPSSMRPSKLPTSSPHGSKPSPHSPPPSPAHPPGSKPSPNSPPPSSAHPHGATSSPNSPPPSAAHPHGATSSPNSPPPSSAHPHGATTSPNSPPPSAAHPHGATSSPNSPPTSPAHPPPGATYPPHSLPPSPAHPPGSTTSPNSPPPSAAHPPKPTSMPLSSPPTTSMPTTKAKQKYCSEIAIGSGTPGKHKNEFRIDVVLYADAALDDTHYKKFKDFLQYGVAPKSVGCDVDWDAIFPTNKRRELEDNGISTITVHNFDAYKTSQGTVCGPPSSYCSDGSFAVTTTGNDEASLDEFPSIFLANTNESINESTLQMMGLRSIGKLTLVKNGGSTEKDGGSAEDPDNEGKGVSSVVGDQVAPAKSSLETGPIVAVVFSGIALFLVIMLAVYRKHVRSFAAAALKPSCTIDEDSDQQDERTSLCDDDGSSPRRRARVFDDTDDEIGWRRISSVGAVPPVYSTVVDDHGFPVGVELRQNGHPMYNYYQENLHPLDETCSNPTCHHCRKKMRATVFVSTKDDSDKRIEYQPASRLLAERNYLAEDTVEL